MRKVLMYIYKDNSENEPSVDVLRKESPEWDKVYKVNVTYEMRHAPNLIKKVVVFAGEVVYGTFQEERAEEPFTDFYVRVEGEGEFFRLLRKCLKKMHFQII